MIRIPFSEEHNAQQEMRRNARPPPHTYRYGNVWRSPCACGEVRAPAAAVHSLHINSVLVNMAEGASSYEELQANLKEYAGQLKQVRERTGRAVGLRNPRINMHASIGRGSAVGGP